MKAVKVCLSLSPGLSLDQSRGPKNFNECFSCLTLLKHGIKKSEFIDICLSCQPNSFLCTILTFNPSFPPLRVFLAVARVRVLGADQTKSGCAHMRKTISPFPVRFANSPSGAVVLTKAIYIALKCCFSVT